MDGLDADRVGERDVAALQIVAGSGDDGAALGDGDAAQQRGRGDGAAQAQVHVAGQLGIGVLEVQLRRGDEVHIEADVVGRGVGRRDGLHGVGLRGEGGDVQVGADGEAGDEHVAGEQQVVLRALQVQRGVGQGADALRIANANALAGDREVGIDAVLVGQVAAHAEQAAAAHGGQGLDLQTVLVELQRAMQLAEAVGHVLKRQRAVLEVDAALQAGILRAGRALPPGRWWFRSAVRSGSRVSASLRLMEPLAARSSLLLALERRGCPGRASRCLRR